MEDKGVIVSKEGFEKLEKELDYLRTNLDKNSLYENYRC